MKFGKGFRDLKLFYGVLLLMLISGSASVFGQNDKPKVPAEEAAAAKKIDAAKSFPEKLSTASDFLKKYPQSTLHKQITDYLAGQALASKDDSQTVTNAQSFITAFPDPADSDSVIPSLIDRLVHLKRIDEAFAVADKYLPRHEEDVAVRLQLSIEGSNQLRVSNTKYAQQTKDYSSQAIQSIEADKKPASMTDVNWKEYQTKWLPELYTALGFAYFALNDPDTAKVCFQKTVTLDPNNITGWYMVGTTLNDNYQDLAKQYTVASGSDKPALLSKANDALDKVIDAFAHVTALTEGNQSYQPLNAQVKQDLESYYKYRHNNSTAGMQELIDKYKPAKTN